MLQQTTDADTISFMFCFSFMMVFKFIAATCKHKQGARIKTRWPE